LTATPSAAARAGEGVAAGGDGYLVQPTLPEELIAAVRALIENRTNS
jgi:DNA-binding response OmpR family regulator